MININSIRKKNILVVGDAMLDTYYYGEVKRISPEAPVPVFRKKNQKSVLGGAANVATNLIAAGQNAAFMAVVGDDENGRQVKSLLEEQGIDASMLLTRTHETTVKTRFMAGNRQQVIRLDIEDTSPMDIKEADGFIELFKRRIDSFDMIVVSDYNKGFLTEYFLYSIINIAKQKDKRVLIDVKDSNFHKYSGAYLLKPNKKELHDLTGMPVENDEQVFNAAEYLRKESNVEYVLTTCGARGMLLNGKKIRYSINAVGREVYDVTGAGDTTISYLAACLANNIAIEDSVQISNIAAGLQVAKVGTSCVNLHEVRECLFSDETDAKRKVISLKEATNLRVDYHNKKIVFTNGCFDILHAGHIRYLQRTSELGDILVVGLNSDQSVKRLKGLDRPVNDQDDRAEVLSALECVDYIVVFEEDTPYKLIETIEPDVLVKGGDYKNKEIIGSEFVKSRGGRVELIDFVPGKSTTKIIDKINNRED